MKTLVAGWFSFEKMGATAGDLLSRDHVCDWLEQAGIEHDVALASSFKGGVAWQAVEPLDYSHVIFVCGPFGNGWPITEFLPRFSHARLIGLNLSMLQALDEWNPFDLLLERDSSRTARPDLVFLTQATQVPVVGRVLVHPQKEYGANSLHDKANEAIERLTNLREMAVVPIDTRLDENATGLRHPSEVESLIARMDLVLTTRLHGLVLALKNGVPALAIDPIAGGAKVRRQAETIDWPFVFNADELDDDRLATAMDDCLQQQARAQAEKCAKEACKMLDGVRGMVLDELSATED
jgi:hypothetical protein